jgi:2-oxoglutarate ferredoxin oxidoreductase subunit beta
MVQQSTPTQAAQTTNKAGLTRNDYRGSPSTLCQGCGHNGIAAQIVAACYEMDLVPEKWAVQRIGCSSKSPTIFWDDLSVSTA